MKVMQGGHMSQLGAIQPPGRQFVQRGNPADFRLGAKLGSACESLFRDNASRERRKSRAPRTCGG